jgi:hypothetical protein
LFLVVGTLILRNHDERRLANEELQPEAFLRRGMGSSVVASNQSEVGESRKLTHGNDSLMSNKSHESQLETSQFVWEDRIIEPQYTPREKVQVIKGNAVANESNQGLFLVVSDARSGAEMLLRNIDGHGLCASTATGDYPAAALLPNTMPWLDDSLTEKGCTFAFVRDSLHNILSDKRNDDNSSNNTPTQCQADYDSTHDPLKNHLPRFCRFLEDLHGDTSAENIARIFVNAYISDDQNKYTGCHCNKNTRHKGMKLSVEWLDQIPLHQTAFHGSKIIRLTRRNLFERYLSMVMAYRTEVYQVIEISHKQTQVEKFKKLNFEIDIDEMLSELERFRSDDEKGDAWTRDNAEVILQIDYDDLRTHPGESFAKILLFLGNEENYNSDIGKILEFQQFRASNLLAHVRNRDQVMEALGANGYGHFVGKRDYQEIQQLVYNAGATFRNANEIPGLRTTVLGGMVSKASALATLRHMPPDRLVVLTDGQLATRNPHVRNMALWYRELANLRANLSSLGDGVVVVSVSREFPTSLSHSSPGSLFDESRRRTATACGKNCGTSEQTEYAEQWKEFLNQRIQQQNQEGLYPDGTYIAGTASALSNFLDELQLHDGEDERAVVSDYMFRNQEKLVLDFSQEFFGARFDGIESQMEHCETEKIDFTTFTTSSHPLLLQHSRSSSCKEKVDRDEYPKWDGNAVEADPILEHIDTLLIKNVSLHGVERHFAREILYVFEQNGVWGSQVLRDIYRVQPTEKFLAIVHDEWLQNGHSSSRWKGLQRVMNSGVGFPYFAWYGDWKSCGTNNAGDHKSVPLFTTCALRDCEHSFPSPAYMTIIDRQEDTRHWFNFFRMWDKDFPWESKQRQVIWRGGLTENNPDKVFDSQRWRLTKLVHELPDPAQKELFDVGLTHVPEFLSQNMNIDVSQVGGFKPGTGGMNNFQKYMAVLDADGNSWSSRFGTLLCYNSIAIKVEPQYLDYFYNDLVPWKHYVPVKADLSDLVENVSFILDPTNDVLAREIVANANQWCSERFTTKELAHDMLDIFESYVQMLDHADPDWTTKWEHKKRDLFDSPVYDMLKIK